MDSKIPGIERKRLEMPSLYYEINATLLTYAYAMANRANEFDGQSEEKLVKAADLLCRSAGVFQFLTTEILPKLDFFLENVKRTPPETNKSIVSGLAAVVIADAQLIGIQKAVLKQTVSASLLSRIAVTATEQLSTTQGLFASRRDLDEGLLAYVRDNRFYAQAVSYRYFGQDSEKRKSVGEAVVWYSSARDLLKKIKSKNMASKTSLLLKELDILYSNAKTLNDTVMFEREPPLTDLISQVPSGRILMEPKQFYIPNFAFNVSEEDGESRVGDAVHPRENSYAAQGQYY